MEPQDEPSSTTKSLPYPPAELDVATANYASAHTSNRNHSDQKSQDNSPRANSEGLHSPALPHHSMTTRGADVYVESQEHLLRPTTDNPQPTSVPPPIAAVAGLLGVRHVLCILGLPERGKCFIAQRLSKYLHFFHGAEVRLFDVNTFMRHGRGSVHNARDLTGAIKSFMEGHATSDIAARNMHVKRAASREDSAGGAAADSRGSAGDVSASVDASSAAEVSRCEEELLVDENDKRRKNVDSGKVAIIFSSDGMASFYEHWACTSKERRRWAADAIQSDTTMGAKLIFIEVIVNRDDLLRQNVRNKFAAAHRNTSDADSGRSFVSSDADGVGVAAGEVARRSVNSARMSSFDESDGEEGIPQHVVRDFVDKCQRYSRIYVSMQEDGSEDDLSYIKLINYGEKVVTNRMHGYLRMRIAQFLTVIHPTEHTIYLTRHGQSEYNVLGKIGGNPPLSAAGAEFARRLAQWTAPHAFALRGRLAKCRLWTSSLQRTILTASHIPHPVIPYSLFGKPMASYEVRTALGIATPAEVEAHNAAMSAEAESALSNSPPRVRRPSSHAHDWSPSLAPTDLSMDADQDMPLLSGSVEQPRVDPVWHQCAPRVYRNLDEIFAGEYEGKTYEAVKALAPDEASLRARDKIGYRYPRGESYFDILARLDPLVHELESYHEPLIIVSHQAVLRLIYSYLKGYSRAKAPRIEIPLHTVIKITYDGWNPPHEERFFLGPNIDKTQEGQQNL